MKTQKIRDKLMAKKQLREEYLGIKLSKNELEILKELAKLEERNLSDTARIWFMREARGRIPSSALKNVTP